ncbi:MAG: cupin domain-containing protein [Proteobacteria bacterium]|nr:cupin domain-containing protein [Pseudomonadota bacterium]
MFAKYSEDGFLTPIEGIEMKTLVHGEKSLLTRFHLKKDSLLPAHSHPHEQTGFLVSGKMTLYIDQKGYGVEPGDSWSIPGNIEHRAEVVEDSVAIEVFSPVRKEYLPAPAGEGIEQG